MRFYVNCVIVRYARRLSTTLKFESIAVFTLRIKETKHIPRLVPIPFVKKSIKNSIKNFELTSTSGNRCGSCWCCCCGAILFSLVARVALVVGRLILISLDEIALVAEIVAATIATIVAGIIAIIRLIVSHVAIVVVIASRAATIVIVEISVRDDAQKRIFSEWIAFNEWCEWILPSTTCRWESECFAVYLAFVAPIITILRFSIGSRFTRNIVKEWFGFIVANCNIIFLRFLFAGTSFISRIVFLLRFTVDLICFGFCARRKHVLFRNDVYASGK